MAKVDDKIEVLIEADKWNEARKLIISCLRKEPENHWYVSRLALTYYEQYEYKKAYALDKKAFRLAPNCPLVLWGYAGSLEVLNRKRAALKIYQSLVKRGVQSLAFGECGEGLARARGLVADCLYRMAYCYDSLGQYKKAMAAFKKHFDFRGPGCHSIYRLNEVRKEQIKMRKKHAI